MERVNGVIVEGLRRLLQALPEHNIEELLPDVLAGLCFLPHKLGH